ncbi:hypothetical protein HPB51_019786 [Rhipicephalus microplus]|uniref:Uncharacterized protein n=1 Tax=Rhipicephalus microplus TaxID=6941 RepID=A0A9J6E3I5_RHIMP|nr:hypothetical protein HPB51_019786 [Rhipicephalus microplus]
MQTLKELAIPLLKKQAHGGAAGGNNNGGSVSCGGPGNGTSMAPSTAPRLTVLPISLQNIAWMSVIQRAQAAAEANAAAAAALAAAAVSKSSWNGHQGTPPKLKFSVANILNLTEAKFGSSSSSYIGANGQPPVLPTGGGTTGTTLSGGSVGGGVCAADLCGGPTGGWTTAGHVHGGNASSGGLGQDLGAPPYSLHYGGMCPDQAYRWFHPTPDMLSYSALALGSMGGGGMDPLQGQLPVGSDPSPLLSEAGDMGDPPALAASPHQESPALPTGSTPTRDALLRVAGISEASSW